MKKCPFCAELIQDEAVVCRFCGRELTQQLGRVTITRADLSYGIMRKLQIYMDEKRIGDVSTLKTVEFDVRPGDHEFYVKMDWAESPRLRFHIRPGETFNFGTKAKGAGGCISMFYTFFNSKNLYMLYKLDIKEP